MRLQIAQIGEEVLREPANELSCEESISAKTRELIEHIGGQAGGTHLRRSLGRIREFSSLDGSIVTVSADGTGRIYRVVTLQEVAGLLEN